MKGLHGWLYQPTSRSIDAKRRSTSTSTFTSCAVADHENAPSRPRLCSAQKCRRRASSPRIRPTIASVIWIVVGIPASAEAPAPRRTATTGSSTSSPRSLFGADAASRRQALGALKLCRCGWRTHHADNLTRAYSTTYRLVPRAAFRACGLEVRSPKIAANRGFSQLAAT